MRRPAEPMASTTLLSSLPLTQDYLNLLQAADFRQVGDLDGLTVPELAADLRSTSDIAADILLIARGGNAQQASNGNPSTGAPRIDALTLLHQERQSRRIITLSKELDMLLGNGVPLRQLTEFSGVPGVGKTQLAMQLALNAQIPQEFNGVDGSAIYIDTEGSFHAPRALQMADGLIRKLGEIAENGSEQQRAAVAALDARRMLGRIHLFRVHDASEQLAAIRTCAEYTAQLGVKVVVVDSVAFHVRHTELTYTRRTQLMGQMAQSLAQLALDHGLAVVLINQVTTRVNEAMGTSALVPALGDSWAHVSNLQLTLSWRDGQRLATLYKGGVPGEASYKITADGIRSAHEMAPPPARSDGQLGASGRPCPPSSSMPYHPPPPQQHYYAAEPPPDIGRGTKRRHEGNAMAASAAEPLAATNGQQENWPQQSSWRQ